MFNTGSYSRLRAAVISFVKITKLADYIWEYMSEASMYVSLVRGSKIFPRKACLKLKVLFS